MARHYSVGKCFFYAAYLALASMGAFTFISQDAPRFEEFPGKMPAQGAFLAAPAYPVEYPAICNTKDHSFSPLRQCLPRMVLPLSFFAAGSGLLYAALRLITKAAAHDIKNTILLKLLI
jgi:hypothetical protein